MEFRRYKDIRCKGDWEWNWVGKKYNLRIARSQFAFWINYRPVFNFLFGFHNENNPRRVSGTTK